MGVCFPGLYYFLPFVFFFILLQYHQTFSLVLGSENTVIMKIISFIQGSWKYPLEVQTVFFSCLEVSESSLVADMLINIYL